MKKGDICGKEVKEDTIPKDYSCNAAVLGEYIKIKGHKRCVDAVDNLVVIPNRIRLLRLKIK